MAPPVLVTKLFIPHPRSNAVPRPRLIEQLNEGLQRSLSVISAPAGFGKTTLVSEWVAGRERPAAWLSLDDGDNDPARFLIHLVAALQTIAAGVGDEVARALQSSSPPPLEVILTALLNDIAALPDRFILVLDDYHLVDARPIDDALIFLLEHLPAQMHLVITTREDPQFPLARLRARGQLTEVRAAHLRFTPAEAADFLNRVMDLDLSPADVAALEDRTEGWIAGLQLAALSLQGHDDVSSFIGAFAGDHRYIVDYLVDEVLQRQPEDIRNFLLQTAILDRLTGSLCDAVTGQQGGGARLEALERGNFFLVSLDEQRRWYRYHHLFADMLSARLRAEQPEQVAMLHRRASEWYERYGSAADAIRHALAGEDFERAADLIEPAVGEMRRTRQEAQALAWLKAIPDTLFHVRPVLSALYASMLLVSGRREGVAVRLRDAERWLDSATDRDGMIIVDHDEFRRLPAEIATWRAGLALVSGEVTETMRYAHQALDLVSEDDYVVRGSGAALLGLSYWTTGDLETAYLRYAEGQASLQSAEHLSDVLGCAIALADIRIAQGRLHDAMHIYEQALALAAEQGEPVLRGTPDMYVGLSALHCERNDLDAAAQLLLRSKQLGDLVGLPQNPYRWCVVMARIREAQGDLDGALDLLQEAEHLYVSDFFPNVRPISALKARVWVRQGRVDEAIAWVQEQGLSVEDDLSYLREFQHVTLARVLLGRYASDRGDRSLQEALELLDRLQHAAEGGGRAGSVLEISMLQALAHAAHGDVPAALVSLERALVPAELEGYVRAFVDEGPPMARLLRDAVARRIRPAYAGALLAAYGIGSQPSASPLPTSLSSQALVEPLSERELDVLRLLGTDLAGPEIARELVVAPSTFRTHTKRIYSKLGVTNRRAAVKRAADLGLI